jgi:hypothetical protein
MLTDDVLSAIDVAVRRSFNAPTAIGTVTARTSTTDALVVFDGSQGPVPVKVAGSVPAYEGDRVYLGRFGPWWTVVGVTPYRGIYQQIYDVTVGPSAVSGITFSGIPANYRHLKLVGTLRSDALAFTADVRLRLNGDTGNRYSYLTLDVRETQAGGAPSVATANAATGFDWAATVPAASTFGGTRAGVELTIFDSTDTAYNTKEMYAVSGFADVGTLQHMHFRWGVWDATVYQPVNTIELVPSSGNFVVGSRLGLWGIA